MTDSTLNREQLRSVVTLVRRRWRTRTVLRGAAITLAVLVFWLVAGGILLDQVRFSPAAVVVLRGIGWLALLGAAAWFVLRPGLRRVSDEQVALYIEEHEPGLGSLVVNAVEQAGVPGAERSLADRVVADAVAQLRDRDDGRGIDRRPLQQAGAGLGGLLAVGALFVALGSPGLRQAVRTLLVPWEDAAAATPYAVLVEPGHATVARGGDQEIVARLRGFTTSQVEILYRTGAEPEWHRMAMAHDDSAAAFVFRLFDLTEPTEYVVEANGVRSPVYRLNVADLPAVQRFSVEVRFPAFTGLPTERHDPGGDLVALRGSRAAFAVTSTMPTTAGRLVTTAGDTVVLRPGDGGVLEGTLDLTQSLTYRFELQTSEGRYVEASLGYRIDLVDDRAPTVLIRKPGRDAQATAIEEVLTEAEAYDDYGVRRLALRFRVNGGEERTVVLAENGRREVSAAHTLFLEEWTLQAGDVITYFAEATDNGPGAGQTTASDIYFLRIRAFGKDYRQAEQQSAPGMQGQGDSPEGLSEMQRLIIAGTFKVRRDESRVPADQTREDLATLALSQGQLRERVTNLTQQMARRNAAALDSGFTIILNELAQATPAMTEAERLLGERKPGEALPAEEKALVHLQRAEEAYRVVQVSFGQQQGGGGGQSQANAEDLADLFELETDKLRNQYETLARSDQQQAEARLDETLERLRQLASRQQQENERLQRAAQNLQSQQQGQQQGGGGASGSQQRRMADEAEEMARQLERLAREQSSPEAAEAARQLRDAAEAMRRSATGQAGSAAQGEDAAERLRRAARTLEAGRNARTEQAVEAARQQAQDLAEREREIGRDVERALRERGGTVVGDLARQLSERKDSLAAGVARLESELDRLARETGAERPEAGRQLSQAGAGLRDDRVQDKIRFSKGLLRGSSPEYARNFEESIAANLDSAAARIGRAAGAVRQANANDPSRALEQAQRLVRGLESLRDRAREGQQQDQQGQQGQQQGQQGQQGPGAQGQGGQAGQAQSGQGGQGGQAGEGQREAGGQVDPNRTGGGRPTWADPNSARQLGRELSDRRRAADSLLAEVERLGFDGGDLRDIVAELRRLENGRLFNDPTGLERLERDVLERLKAFEFALRRQVDGDAARPLVGPSDQVPPRFRELVEEYYRSLARSGRPVRPPAP